MTSLFQNVRRASLALPQIEPDVRNKVLLDLADIIDKSHSELLAANARDLSRMDPQNPLYDRLKLTDDRLDAIASDMRHVVSLSSPEGEIIEQRTLENGLIITKVRVPFGVVGVIYEARPNVTFDVFSLCFKSGNACVLKGGRDAENSNEAAISLIHRALEANGVNPDVALLLPSTHEATGAMLSAVGYIDVCIPRGGRRLIDFVRDNAKVPVIETGAGVVHCYFDTDGDLSVGQRVVENAKCRRVSVCNALDTLIVNSSRLADLPALVEALALKNVEIVADERGYEVLSGTYPYVSKADDSTFDTEWMAHKMGLRIVDTPDEAIDHIARHGSGHSESIVTENSATARRFTLLTDAACVYVNAPTSFTDGAQFGLGAEIGISTQKLGPRGPMGLREITTYKYIIEGNGQTRP